MKTSSRNHEKNIQVVFGCVTGILGVVLAIGAQTFARPCTHADGSTAVCDPLRTWLALEGGLIVLLAGIAVFRSKAFWKIAETLCGLLAILTPGVLAPVCRNDAMRCRQVTQPTALVLGILVMLLALWWTVLTIKTRNQEVRR